MTGLVSFGNLATETAEVRLCDVAAGIVGRFQTFTLHEPAVLVSVCVKLRVLGRPGPALPTRPTVPSNVLVSIQDVADGLPGRVTYASSYIPGPDIGDRVVCSVLDDLPALGAGQYALVLRPEEATRAPYALALVPGRPGEHFGTRAVPGPIGPILARERWVDETSLGCAWMDVTTYKGGGETIDVTNRARTGRGFGGTSGELARYQTFYATHASQTLAGVDVRLRRVGLGPWSDVLVHLHGMVDGLPAGEPLVTAFIPAASIGSDWTTVHADLRHTGLAPDTPYAVALTPRAPRLSRYEWASAEVDNGLRSGRWTGSAWVDDSAGGDTWVKALGDGAHGVAPGDHAGRTALGFGNATDEVRRWQVVDLAAFVGKPVYGVDLMVRRAFGVAQSDLTVALHATAGDRPVGAPLASATVPAGGVTDAWTTVHAPLWLTSVPAARVALVVGQAVPQTARYEWAVGHVPGASPPTAGPFGKWTPTGCVDESSFGTGWFRLWVDHEPVELVDSTSAPTAWYGFGNAVDEMKRFEIVDFPEPYPQLRGIELLLRKAFGTGQSDVVVQVYPVANGMPTAWPVAETVIPAWQVSADLAGSIHRVIVPVWPIGPQCPFAVVLGQRTPQAARYEWATGASSGGRAFGKWNGAGWVDESGLGAGWVRLWLRPGTP